MHAIGVPEGVTLLEFEPVHPEKQQQAQEPEVQTLVAYISIPWPVNVP